ncbi:hypothetical protein JHK85_030804 [Glycine max]|nr:hypothetical protein JHK85_030804 [Glycine max]
MHKYFTIFVAVLVACHGSLFAHGRQIKPLNQHSSLLNTKPTILAPLRTSIKLIDAPIVPKFKFADVDSGDSGADHANAFRPTTPGNSPGVGHKKFEGEDKGMKVMGTLVHSPDVKASVADAGSFENDFRPTDPEGRGLKATTKSPKSVSVKAMSTTKGAVAKPSQLETIAKSLNGFVEAFRPTTPGHSPGVGHSVNN